MALEAFILLAAAVTTGAFQIVDNDAKRPDQHQVATFLPSPDGILSIGCNGVSSHKIYLKFTRPTDHRVGDSNLPLSGTDFSFGPEEANPVWSQFNLYGDRQDYQGTRAGVAAFIDGLAHNRELRIRDLGRRQDTLGPHYSFANPAEQIFYVLTMCRDDNLIGELKKRGWKFPDATNPG